MKSGKWFETTVMLLLIALCAIMCTIIADATNSGHEHWSVHMNATPYMYVGHNDRLYVFDTNDVYAINPDGSLAWKYFVPANWSVICRWDRVAYVKPSANGGIESSYDVRSYPVFADDNGTLYLYVYQNPFETVYHHDNVTGQYSREQKINNVTSDKLLAIRNGSILWEKQLPVNMDVYSGTDMSRIDGVSLDAAGGRLYLFRSHNLTVLSQNGTDLYEIRRISDPPAIDEQGRIYLVEAYRPEWLQEYTSYAPELAMPSNTVKAYASDGSLLWSSAIDGTIIRPERIYMISTTSETLGSTPVGQYERLTLPIYENGRIIVPLRDGAEELDTGGEAIWTHHFGCDMTLIQGTPYDNDGNVYLAETDQSYYQHYNGSPKLAYIVAPDGNYTVSELWYGNESSYMIGAADGTAYFDGGVFNSLTMPDLNTLLPMNLTARDLRTGKNLWTFEVPANYATTVTVTGENIGSLLTDDWAIEKSIYYNKDHPLLRYETGLKYDVYGQKILNVLPAGDVVYVSYYGFNYEYPALPEGQAIYTAGTANTGWIYTPVYVGTSWGFPFVATFNKSRLTYASGICALDRNGTLLWQKPTDSFVMGMTANNSTIYYGTRNGGVSGIALAAGVTAIAAALLFLRFFFVGTVSRARSRLDQNENRLAILKCVQDKPGSTMYEIARTLDINMGTLRYHLLILGLNHKVREHRDGKYVRYFPGTQSFTPDELEVMSLLRREPVRRLMSMLCEKPGISNVEIARALGISESAVSNYMKELSTKGFVSKEVTPAGRVAYTIRKEHIGRIERSLETG